MNPFDGIPSHHLAAISLASVAITAALYAVVGRENMGAALLALGAIGAMTVLAFKLTH